MKIQLKQTIPSFSGLNDVIPFGKHRGKTVGTTIQDDPQYILWASDNHVMKFTTELLDYADEAYDDLQYGYGGLMGDIDDPRYDLDDT